MIVLELVDVFDGPLHGCCESYQSHNAIDRIITRPSNDQLASRDA